MCIALCTIVARNIAKNRPDNFPSYPPDNHHCSDDVYLREGGVAYSEREREFTFATNLKCFMWPTKSNLENNRHESSDFSGSASEKPGLWHNLMSFVYSSHLWIRVM